MEGESPIYRGCPLQIQRTTQALKSTKERRQEGTKEAEVKGLQVAANKEEGAAKVKHCF